MHPLIQAISRQLNVWATISQTIPHLKGNEAHVTKHSEGMVHNMS
jgi:hypothetical protein